MLSKRARPIIQELFNKTYNEQALGDAPFGLSPDSKVCSYPAGCAIGRFLPPELSRKLGGSIESVLIWPGEGFEHFDEARRQLLGGPEVPALGKHDPDVICLQRIQGAHDNSSHTTDRNGYRLNLIRIARECGLSVPDEEEHGALPAD